MIGTTIETMSDALIEVSPDWRDLVWEYIGTKLPPRGRVYEASEVLDMYLKVKGEAIQTGVI